MNITHDLNYDQALMALTPVTPAQYPDGAARAQTAAIVASSRNDVLSVDDVPGQADALSVGGAAKAQVAALDQKVTQYQETAKALAANGAGNSLPLEAGTGQVRTPEAGAADQGQSQQTDQQAMLQSAYGNQQLMGNLTEQPDAAIMAGFSAYA